MFVRYRTVSVNTAESNFTGVRLVLQQLRVFDIGSA
jgi:hypothetical protein